MHYKNIPSTTHQCVACKKTVEVYIMYTVRLLIFSLRWWDTIPGREAPSWVEGLPLERRNLFACRAHRSQAGQWIHFRVRRNAA